MPQRKPNKGKLHDKEDARSGRGRGHGANAKKGSSTTQQPDQGHRPKKQKHADPAAANIDELVKFIEQPEDKPPVAAPPSSSPAAAATSAEPTAESPPMNPPNAQRRRYKKKSSAGSPVKQGMTFAQRQEQRRKEAMKSLQIHAPDPDYD